MEALSVFIRQGTTKAGENGIEIFSLSAKLGLDDSAFLKGIAGAQSAFQKFGSGVSSVGSAAMKIGTDTAKIFAAVGGAAVALGGAGVKVGMDFEAGMSQVAATMGIAADKGDASFKMLSDAAKEAGSTTQFSATEASEALNYLALAGYDAEKSVTALPSVLNLAAAGGLELGYASDLVTDSMAALGMETNQLDTFIDQMSKTSQKSNTSIGQLGEAILTVGGTAKDLSGGTVELNTALGVLADVGIKGSEGGTKLRNVIMSLTAPTDKAAASMESLGISAYDADGNMRPIEDTLGDINQALGGMTQQQQKEWLNTVFNKQDLAAVSGLLGATSVNFDQLANSINASNENINISGTQLSELAALLGTAGGETQVLSTLMEQYGLSTEQANGIMQQIGETADGTGTRFSQLAAEVENSMGSASQQARTMIDNLKGDLTILSSALEGLGIQFYESVDSPLREIAQTATGYIGDLSNAFAGVTYDAGTLADALGVTELAGATAGETMAGAQEVLQRLGMSTQEADQYLRDFEADLRSGKDSTELTAKAMELFGYSQEGATATRYRITLKSFCRNG